MKISADRVRIVEDSLFVEHGLVEAGGAGTAVTVMVGIGTAPGLLNWLFALHRSNPILALENEGEDSVILPVERSGPHQLPSTSRRYCDRTPRTKREADMLKAFAAAIFSLILFGMGTASAEDCSHHCDYWHNYGPCDFLVYSTGLDWLPTM